MEVIFYTTERFYSELDSVDERDKNNIGVDVRQDRRRLAASSGDPCPPT